MLSGGIIVIRCCVYGRCASAFGIPGMVPDVAGESYIPLLRGDFSARHSACLPTHAHARKTFVGFNKRFHGLTPNSTNVFACNGSDDPWQVCGVACSQ